jgi:hypothetical protein
MLCYIIYVSLQNFELLGGSAGLLRPFIWSRVSDLMRIRDGSNSERSSNFAQISEKV